MFADEITLALGDETVKVRRMTRGEIREKMPIIVSTMKFETPVIDEECEKLMREHVRCADGSPLDPDQLSLPQLTKLCKALVGLPDEGGLSDFIGLLC